MSLVVTGAGGFVGRALVARLLAEPRLAGTRILVSDSAVDGMPTDERITTIEGDIRDPAFVRRLRSEPVDMVIHLAGVLGGAAEADYALSRAVNIDATLAMFEALRNSEKPPRVVFASSIAVFGVPLPDRVDDKTVPLPTMTYGAQKLMMEMALGTFSRRGELDGVAVRLPGIVARPASDGRLRSAFLSQLFHDVAAGRDIVLPVSPGGTTWLMSRETCAANLVRAALLPAGAMGQQRSVTLPALRVSMATLVAALQRRFPSSRSRVSFAPDPEIESQFAAYPVLETAAAERLGFAADADVDSLVEAAFV